MWTLLLALVLPSPAYCSDEVPDVYMHALTKEVMVLQRYLFSGPAFLSAKNEEEISSSLEAMNMHLEKLGKGTFKSDPALRINLALLSEQMANAQDSFREGEKSYSRYMIQSSLQMCVTCHTRTRSHDFALPDTELKAATPMEKADFYFATRQFDKGKEELDKILRNYSGDSLGPGQLNRVLISLAIYYARVKEDPEGGYRYFKKVSENRKFPTYVKSNLSAWTRDFRSWSLEPKKLAEEYPYNAILPKARKLLAADQKDFLNEYDSRFHVRWLRASTLLYRILEAPGMTVEKGEALLSLGRIFQKIKYQSFYRLGEMHFKACIREFPKTKSSRLCYEALEQAFFERYAGEAAEEVELIKLKHLAY